MGKSSVFMVSQLQSHSANNVSYFHGSLTPSSLRGIPCGERGVPGEEYLFFS